MAVSLRDLPIKRKVTLVTFLTSAFALLLMAAALIVYERLTFRRNLVRNTEAIAKLVGSNASAALAFSNEQDANDALGALSAERLIVAAALYDDNQALFAQYLRSSLEPEVPPLPGEDGHVFSPSRLGMFGPIVNPNGKRIGTIYIRTDLQPMYERFWFYGGLLVVVGAASALGAMGLSTVLQRRITVPIVELASAARRVSEKEDYTVRAAKYGHDELGELTDTFNKMLERIQESRNALAASEERLRLALEGSKTGTWDLDLRTGRMVWDDYMYPLLGIPRESFDGTPATAILSVHPDDREEVDRQTQLAIEQKADFKAAFRVLTGEGTIRYMASRGRAFYDGSGRAVRMSGVTMDVTESRLTEDALQQAKDAAEAANKAKDDFLAILSHELRTPLTPVLAGVAMIEEDRTLPPRVLQDVAMIRRNIEVEARLIDDLLDVTRIARGKLELNRHVVDARALLAHAMQNYCIPAAEKRGIEVRLDGTAVETCVLADTSRLTQVFWNLLQNAVKFTPDGGTVKVRIFNAPAAENERPEVVIEIQDNGVGIDPELLPRIFDAFEQGERARTRLFGGLGLGLAISRAIVELHGGSLTASSGGRGKGAVFTLQMRTEPRSEAAPQRPKVAAAPGSGGGERALRILLVEDHSDTAAQLTRLLQRGGHHVTWAGSIAKAREIVGASAAGNNGALFDLVISDLGLPDGTGHELMRELSSQHQLRGIALSGYGMEADIRESREAGFNRHLTKPVDWQELKLAIDAILDDAEAAPHLH